MIKNTFSPIKFVMINTMIIPAALWRSLWQTPQNFILMRTSFGNNGRRCICMGLKSHPVSEHAMHSVEVLAVGEWATASSELDGVLPGRAAGCRPT